MLTERVVNVQVDESIKRLVLSIYRPGLPVEERLTHIPPQPAMSDKMSVCIYRNMVKVRVPGVQPERLRDTKRAVVSLEFDGKKRKRMLDKFNSWRFRCENAAFCHLTYPAEYPQNWRLWKLNLKEFKRLLLKRFPQAEGMWKLELQKRGAPHFHLVIDFRARCSIKRLRQWVDAAWARIAHQDDVHQGKYACRVEPIWSIRHCLNYAAKYCNKINAAPIGDDGNELTAADLGDTMGRQWGVIGKPDFSPSQEFGVTSEAFTYMQMRLADALKRRGAKGWFALARPAYFGSYTVYGIGDASDDRFSMAWDLITDIEGDFFRSEDSWKEVREIECRLRVGDNTRRGVTKGQQSRENVEWYAVGQGGEMLPGYPKWVRV